MAAFLRHEACPKCGSSDALAVYAEGGGSHCFSCNYTIPSEQYIESKEESKPWYDRYLTNQVKVKSTAASASNAMKESMQEISNEVKNQKPAITDEDNTSIKERTTVSGSGFRGIRDDVYKIFGVRHSINADTGEVYEQYYPVTFEGQLTGYKIREVPKNFRSKGRTGADCDLFMSFRFNRGGKYLLITEGEIDSLSAYQMISDYNKQKGSDFETAVVSPTTGAQSKKQIANNYKFIDSFDQVILCMDSDDAGQKAAQELVKYLPKGKVKMMQMRFKDANEYLQKGKQKEFISDFYNAKSYAPAGVVGSSQLYDRLLESVQTKKIPLPGFMSKLDEMLGSIECGSIGIIAAGSGAAKTTVANELIYYWLFNSPYKVGVVSLELTCGQYAQAMLSRHLENKISNIREPEDKVKYLTQEHVKQKADELFKTPDGQDRFMVIDERDGSIEVLQEKIEEMVISCGVKVIILDPISDLFDGLPIDAQASLMKWQKSIVKNYNVTFINISHIRKGSSNKESASTGAFVPEEAVIGASQQVKSASWVVMLQRDKYHESDIIRNCTHIVLTKNRSNGVTGKAGAMYYCNQTHRLYDFDTWCEEHGVTPFES